MILTLPPQIGNHYYYRNKGEDELHECVIIREEKYRDGTTIYKSKGTVDRWTFWPDGEAKIDGGTNYVAVLVEDILILSNISESEEFRELREGHDAMMKRLTKLEA